MNPYASHLAGREPMPILRTTAAELQRRVAAWDANAITQPPAPGKWSLRDMLAHVADTELVFGIRLRQTLAEDHHIIQPFDQDRWAKSYSTLDAPAALATFTAVREWNLRLLEGIPSDAYHKKLTHPERGELTFRLLVETMAGHDISHLQQEERLALSLNPAASEERKRPS